MTRWRFPPRQSIPLHPPASPPQAGDDTRPLADSAIVGRGPNIDTLAKKFFDYLLVERGVSLRTRARYAHAIRRLKDWARWKRKSLQDLTLPDCRRWRLNMRRSGLAPSTVNTNLLAARMFFRFLFFDRYLKGNPFDGVELLPKVESERRWLSVEEIDRLFAVPDVATYYGLLDRALLELLYSSGLRPAELVALRLRDLDLTRRRVTCVGKGSKERLVPLGRSATKWLKKYLSVRGQLFEVRRTNYFFVKEDGSRLSYMYVWRHVKAHAMTAGLHDVTPHILRHTYATHLHEGGAGVAHIQALLGHASDESTKGYTHASPRHLRGAYDRHHPRATMQNRIPDWKLKRQERYRRAMFSDETATDD